MWKPNQGKRKNVADCEKFAMVFLAFSKSNISVRSDCKVHAFGGNHHYRWHLSHFWRRSNQKRNILTIYSHYDFYYRLSPMQFSYESYYDAANATSLLFWSSIEKALKLTIDGTNSCVLFGDTLVFDLLLSCFSSATSVGGWPWKACCITAKLVLFEEATVKYGGPHPTHFDSILRNGETFIICQD